MAEEEKKEELIKVPVAKRHKLLDDITTQLKGAEISDVFEIAGYKYHMSTLSADDEVWADSYCNMSSEVSAYSSLRVPRLAASIIAINGIPLEELFNFSDDIDKASKEFHSASKYRKRYWLMNQLMLMLGELPSKFITELWSNYSDLINRRDRSWDELKKSSARTLGGRSKDTSSPAKESSQVTQM